VTWLKVVAPRSDVEGAIDVLGAQAGVNPDLVGLVGASQAG
jgi:hypothetical protein